MSLPPHKAYARQKDPQAPGLVGCEAKAAPDGHTPPIDVFPAYDEQPGPATDNYTCPPGGSGIRITLQRPIFNNHTGAVRLSMPKTPIFQPVLGKMPS
jgi:hypothetical protein